MTEPVGKLVPMYPEPDEDPGEQSWDAFWAERHPTKTTVIRGVEVRVPTGLTLAYRERSRKRLQQQGEDAFAPLAIELLRAPDGSPIPDLWHRWRDAGMEVDELEVVVAWAIAHGVGEPITFAEAADAVEAALAAQRAEVEAGGEGKARKASTRTRSSGGTGGPSKPVSGRSTASSRRTSRT